MNEGTGSSAGAQPPEQQPAEQRRMRLTGLHHLTAIVRDLNRTTAFYRDLLGLTLVREERNPDDVDARHAWFLLGQQGGSGAGQLVSFMEYPHLPKRVLGPGSVQHFAFIVESADELAAWRDYLRSRGVQATDIYERGGFSSIYIQDPDEHTVEIATRGPGIQ